MLDKPTIYLESTVISYLAAYPSRDLIVAAHQRITREWWDTTRASFTLYTSQAVLSEIGAGDSEAATRRLKFIADLPILPLNEDVEQLALEYQQKLGLPLKAQMDLVHLASSVVHNMDYLLTWNCAHLANGLVISRLIRHNNAASLLTPIIVTPEELLELPEGG